MKFDDASLDYKIIYELVTPNAKVLDLGCGSGELLALLAEGRKAKVQGIELDEAAIYKCVEKGLSVFHGDIDSGLAEYPDNSFDFVILNQTLQQVKKVDFVVGEALRVGKKVIVGFPNFAHYIPRCQLFFKGRSPVTLSLPYTWYETPNLRFLSLYDFQDFCRKFKIKVECRFYITEKKVIYFFPNLFANIGIYVLSK